MTRMTLYGARGWGSTIVEAMLAVADIPHDFVDVDGFDRPGPMREKLIALNPLAQVPTLVLADGTVMTESAAIALLLAELAPGAPLAPPPAAPERPHFLRRLIWLVASVYPTFTYADYPERWTTDEKGLVASVMAHRQQLWLQFEAEVGAPHALGERLSALDIYVAAMVHWRPGRAWFDAKTPRIAAAADAALAHPAIAAVMARNFPAG
ncbi:MAG: glutathione S-transferase [Sphingomonas sp.]|nr:glutathione S-transferase [Sphingomonas sp.]